VARALRRPGLALAAIVALSTVLHWIAGRRLPGPWIMPDEAIYALRGIALWRHGSLPVLHGQGAGYSIVYPVLAGLPLALFSLAKGYAVLKALQAFVMSLSAVVVYFFGRRLIPARYALLAAALTVASPLLLYSGFVMTEVVYYPISALALLTVVLAVETGRLRDQLLALLLIALAVATRTQGVVLVAIFAAGVLVDAALARSWGRLRLFWPVWLVLLAAGASAAVAPGLFGAYAGTLSGGYPIGDSLRLIYYHLAYTVLMVAVAPVAALGVLLVPAVRGRERDAGARALISVTVVAVVLVVIQVGLFSARYAPHLLGRDLASLPAPLFLVFCLWLARGAPRPRLVTSLTVIGVLAIVVGAPWNTLVSDEALPDTMGIALVHRDVWGIPPADYLAVGVAVALIWFRFGPRRAFMPVLVAIVLGTLVATSALASDEVASRVRFDASGLVGTPADWIQQAVDAPVTYVYAGDLGSWNVVWQQRFWNPGITAVVGLGPFIVPGPHTQNHVQPQAGGRLPIHTRYVVANDTIAFVGTPIGHQDRGEDEYGLTLWRLDRPARIAAVDYGFQPNGDILGTASVVAYRCAGGQLQLTLLPKSTDDVEIDLDGKKAVSAHIGGLDYWNGSVGVPAGHRAGPCAFRIRGGLLLGSTHVAFVPAG
jgi:Dolichyl-phosphate-mannose-protein mannosyltransferase